MANRYITISNSTGTLIKQFKVLLEGYGITLVKSETIRHTLDGRIDASRGKVWRIDEYAIQCPYQTTDPDWGTKEDLETLFSLNNPAGSPTDILTVTDHYGTVRTALLTGEFKPKPLGIMIDGPDSYWVIPCTFQYIAEVEGS